MDSLFNVNSDKPPNAGNVFPYDNMFVYRNNGSYNDDDSDDDNMSPNA